MENHERVERELLEQCGRVATLAECFAWMQRCDECIESLEELCRAKQPRQFLEDAGSVVLERVRDAIERHGSVKANTAFNGEFIAGDKRTVMSINTKNCELYPMSNVRECCLHYFNTIEKLEIHSEDCGKLNKCAIRLPSEDKKWLEFRNHRMKERAPFVVYADLECVLKKTEDAASSASSYAHQQHEVCSYDDTLSAYRFHRDNDCVSWFARQLEDLAHCAKNIITTNRPMDFTRDNWQKFNSATHCHICEKPFAPGDERARDHYHLTGRYRGPAHKGCNNLYGWAMCQPLFYADFQWVQDVANFDANAIAPDSPTGYILEVDLEYSQHLHDAHADLPFCPTRDKPPGKREDKLLATLYDKQRYVIHYLQQCIHHGIRVTKIHRVLQFAQSAWLRDYIELNTKFRTLAKNDFEKNLYKLMNNAVFGKTMENVRDRVDVKLVTAWYGAEAMIAKPNFHSRSVFAKNLIAVELCKLEVKFDKPIYVGMCILDISKVCLYEFHHEYMVPMFNKNCKIMYTDTDSLIYRIECDDVYAAMKRDIARFDTSDYPANNVYGMPLANKKVPGLMKDENNGAIMTGFVGLRAKMYALRVDGKKDTKKAKSVKSSVVAQTIMFDDYTRCLNEEIEMTRRQSCIRSKLHQVYTVSKKKIALSPYDDKRYVVPDSTETLPWGHYRIPL
ncbi:hypothetical protein ALC62_00583 [Cyphomyrmex costatus]|uniref:DNA-directed DNA polymerase n=1 Tax=Cyphomyrmex costatus TaxID=456900 RepID=A0A151IQJ1_9HYME|nr:hypothetical protein ALC62_00583 [Cyphomyrmex costatus]